MRIAVVLAALVLPAPYVQEAGPRPPSRTIGEHAGALTSVAFFDKGKQLVTTSEAGEIRLWDARSGRLQAERTWHEDVGLLAVVDDGRSITFVSRSTLCAIETKKAKLRGSKQLDGPARSLVWVPKRRWLFLGYDGGTLHRFQSGDVSGGHDTWGTGAGAVTCLAATPSGELLAGGTREGQLLLMDPRELEVAARWDAHPELVTAVDLSPDGALLISGGEDGSARLWDAALLRELRVLELGAAVTAARLAAEGRLAITADAGGSLVVWKLETGERLAELRPPDAGAIVAFDVDPKGRTLASVGPGTAIDLWDVDLSRLAK